MNKITSTVIGITVSIILVLLSGCEKTTQISSETPVRPVRTTAVQSSPPSIEKRFAGTTHSASKTELSFRVGGRVDKFPANVGQVLKAGEFIAQIDDSDLRLQLERSGAMLSQVNTRMVVNKSRYERISKLHEIQAISDMEFEKIKAAYHTSEAEYLQAQKVVQIDQKQVSYAVLRAPTDGCVLTKAYVNTNEIVSSGQAVASLRCGEQIDVTAVVPESVIPTLSIGQQVSVIVKTHGQALLPAVITEIGLSSSTNGLYFVNAQIAEQSDAILDGMASELVITRTFDEYKGSLWVPLAAMLEEQGQNYVMRYKPGPDGVGGVIKTAVTTDRFVQGHFEVTEGLEERQLVITAGLSLIFDGLTVKAMTEGK